MKRHFKKVHTSNCFFQEKNQNSAANWIIVDIYILMYFSLAHSFLLEIVVGTTL